MNRFFRGVAIAACGLLLPDASGAVPLNDKLDISGFLQFDSFSFFQGDSPGKSAGRKESQLRLSGILTPNDRMKLFLSPEVHLVPSETSRNRFFLHEGYLDLYTEKIDWRFGKQLISWGKSDTVRPTDVWKIRDFRDFFLDEEEGIVAVQARYYGESWSLVGVFVPFFQRHDLPTDSRNRFFLLPTRIPFGPLVKGLSDLGAYDLSYRELTDALPERSPRSAEAGLRLELSREGWDAAFSYAFTHDRFPTFVEGLDPEAPIILEDRPDPIFGNTAVLGLRPVHRRLHVFGGDFSTSVGKLGLRGETAFFLTEDPGGSDSRVDDPYLVTTLGLDYTFANLVGEQDLVALLQYVNDSELPRHGAKNIDEAVNLRHFFEHGLIAVANWKFTEFVAFDGWAFVNLVNGDRQLRPSLRWVPADNIVFTAAARILGGGGGSTSFFSSFNDLDRFELSARFTF